MDPATIAAAGSIASGLGSLASGFGIGQSSPQVDYKGAKRGIRWRVKDAEKAGIHPLYAIGAPGIGSGILQGKSTDPGAGIAGAGRAMEVFADKQAQVQYQRDQEELRQLQKLKLEAEIFHERALSNQVEQQAQASFEARMRQKMGIQQDIPSLYVPYFDNQTGEITYLVSPDANMEANELIGTGYWARGRAISPDNYKPNPYPQSRGYDY